MTDKDKMDQAITHIAELTRFVESIRKFRELQIPTDYDIEICVPKTKADLMKWYFARLSPIQIAGGPFAQGEYFEFMGERCKAV